MLEAIPEIGRDTILIIIGEMRDRTGRKNRRLHLNGEPEARTDTLGTNPIGDLKQETVTGEMDHLRTHREKCLITLATGDTQIVTGTESRGPFT